MAVPIAIIETPRPEGLVSYGDPIQGTALAPEGKFVEYRLEYSLNAGKEWVLLHRGTSEVREGVLGTWRRRVEGRLLLRFSVGVQDSLPVSVEVPAVARWSTSFESADADYLPLAVGLYPDVAPECLRGKDGSHRFRAGFHVDSEVVVDLERAVVLVNEYYFDDCERMLEGSLFKAKLKNQIANTVYLADWILLAWVLVAGDRIRGSFGPRVCELPDRTRLFRGALELGSAMHGSGSKALEEYLKELLGGWLDLQRSGAVEQAQRLFERLEWLFASGGIVARQGRGSPVAVDEGGDGVPGGMWNGVRRALGLWVPLSPTELAFLRGAAAGNLELVSRGKHDLGLRRARSRAGWSALHYACANGRTEVISVPLEAGFPLNRTDREGRTPLHLAAQGGHLGAVVALLKAGADMRTLDGRGSGPFGEWAVLALAFCQEEFRTFRMKVVGG